MNAVLQPREVRLEAMTVPWLEQVASIEKSAYPHPWLSGNFADSLTAGYPCQMLLADTPNGSEPELMGYFVAMKGVDEVHLLNITVAPEFRGEGWSRVMLDALALWARGQGADWLWLEVRVGNERAIKVYDAHGYRQVGRRKSYYPADRGQREDALVMSLRLGQSAS